VGGEVNWPPPRRGCQTLIPLKSGISKKKTPRPVKVGLRYITDYDIDEGRLKTKGVSDGRIREVACGI